MHSSLPRSFRKDYSPPLSAAKMVPPLQQVVPTLSRRLLAPHSLTVRAREEAERDADAWGEGGVYILGAAAARQRQTRSYRCALPRLLDPRPMPEVQDNIVSLRHEGSSNLAPARQQRALALAPALRAAPDMRQLAVDRQRLAEREVLLMEKMSH